MNKVQVALLAILSISGAIGGVWILANLPTGIKIVPGWIASNLPSPQSIGAGWLIFALVGTIVATAIALAFVGKNSDNDSDSPPLGGRRSMTVPAETTSPTRTLARMRVLVSQGLIVAWAVTWLTTLASAADSWWHPLLLLPSAGLTLPPVLRWQQTYAGTRAALGLSVGIVTWTISSLLHISPGAVVAVAIPAAAMIRGKTNISLFASTGTIMGCAAIGLLVSITQSQLTLLYVGLAVLLPAIWALAFWGTRVSWNLLVELDAGHQTYTNLAVLRERFRIAADLHDIQGHTLHVVKLKTALAQRLLRADPDAAEVEIAQIQELLLETIGQSKSLAHGERNLTLAGELENARQLFEADNIDVSVRNGGTPTGIVETLSSLVLREATTNILRHAQANQVHITLTPASILITNDGLSTSVDPDLNGLAVLRKRINEADGHLIARIENDEFITEAEFPGTQERKSL